MVEKIIEINGMSCNHCASSVKNALIDLENVVNVEVLLDKKQAIIILSNNIENNIIREVVESAGYEVIDIK